MSNERLLSHLNFSPILMIAYSLIKKQTKQKQLTHQCASLWLRISCLSYLLVSPLPHIEFQESSKMENSSSRSRSKEVGIILLFQLPYFHLLICCWFFLPGIYLCLVMTMTSVSVIMAVMVINLYNRGMKTRRAPKWLRKLILEIASSPLKMKHDIEHLAKVITLVSDIGK